MEQQLANLTQQLLTLNQSLEQERAARINAEQAIQRLHEEGIRRDQAATQSKSALFYPILVFLPHCCFTGDVK